jgi:hypothetical protein
MPSEMLNGAVSEGVGESVSRLRQQQIGVSAPGRAAAKRRRRPLRISE